MILSRIYPSGYALLNEMNGTIINVVIQRPLKDLPIQQNTQKSSSLSVPSVPSTSSHQPPKLNGEERRVYTQHDSSVSPHTQVVVQHSLLNL